MNHPCMKYPLPLMKYPQLLTSGVIFAIKVKKNKNKNRTFCGRKPSTTSSYEKKVYIN